MCRCACNLMHFNADACFQHTGDRTASNVGKQGTYAGLCDVHQHWNVRKAAESAAVANYDCWH